jgi:uncharacterized membrane protein YeaQ/YmgE (transglycosylase-associated protein family)
MFLGILGWIVVGLIVGFIVSRVVNLRGDDPRMGIGAAVGGAVAAGALYSMISAGGVTAWNLWGLMWAAIGSVLAVVLWHLIRSRTISHERYVPRRSY